MKYIKKFEKFLKDGGAEVFLIDVGTSIFINKFQCFWIDSPFFRNPRVTTPSNYTEDQIYQLHLKFSLLDISCLFKKYFYFFLSNFSFFKFRNVKIRKSKRKTWEIPRFLKISYMLKIANFFNIQDTNSQKIKEIHEH